MVSPNATRFVGYVGAAANWLIPIAGARNLVSQDANNINPVMTATLLVYSTIFWRWAIAISPPNWLLMACHTANATVQASTLGKWAVMSTGKSQSGSSAAGH